jgi:sulfur carrier protein
MKVTVNGNLKEFESVQTIAGLLDTLGIPTTSALIEQNGAVIARREFQTAAVNEGDTIEIVQMAAGG